MIPTLQIGALGRMRKPVGASNPYLDGLSIQPQAVLSLRKRISTATVAVRVRRSSDNAEQDIGFTGDALDTSALATFVSSNSAYVTTFYDQSGNGNDAVQATAANQPRIVNAGTYDGKAVFDGSNDSLSITSVTFGTPQLGIYLNMIQPHQVPVVALLESSTNYNSNTGAFIFYMDDGLYRFGINGGSAWRVDYATASITALKQVTLLGQMAVTDGTLFQHRMWAAGSAATRQSTQGTAATPVVNFTTQNVHIGARAGSSLFAPMSLETLALYNADTSGIRTSIEALVA